MAGTIAGTIDDEQRFARVGQRDHQRMIAPLSFVIDVHAFFALAGGFHHRAIGVDHRLPRKTRRLLLPDLQPRLVEQRPSDDQSAAVVEATAEVTRRGRVRESRCSQGIQVRFFVAAEFQMIQGTFRRPASCRRCSARGPIRCTAR